MAMLQTLMAVFPRQLYTSKISLIVNFLNSFLTVNDKNALSL